MRTLLFGTLALAALAVQSGELLAQEQKGGTEPSDNVKSFDKIWSLIRDRHWDAELVGEKWEQARERLRPKVIDAKTVGEARVVMRELIATLGQSHFAIIPSDAYSDLAGRPSGEGYTGLAVRLREEHLIVTQVIDGSPAAAAGLRPGWIVERIGERTAEQIIERSAQASEKGPVRQATTAGLYTEQLLSGEPGKPVTLVCTDLSGQSRTVEITRAEPVGRKTQFGRMPAVRVHIRSKPLDGGIGYIAFNMFFDPLRLMQAVDECLESAPSGVIIDLRGNHGGMATLTMGIGSRFARQPSELGVMQMRGTRLRFALNPQAEAYRQPVAVLIDECSISAAEILAGGLKDLGLARVFGSTTAGLALPSTFERLPNGDGFQYAFADYQSASGKTLEAQGVVPDVEVPLTPDAWQQHEDPVMSAAMQWIRQQHTKKNLGN